MKRFIPIILVTLGLLGTIASLTYGIVLRDRQITELEHDNAVLARLCGVVRCVPCNKGETGPECQARLGDWYEVIYYPDAGVLMAELRPASESSSDEPLHIEPPPVPEVQP